MEETRQYSALAELSYRRGALPLGIAFVSIAIGAAYFIPRMDVVRLMLDVRLWISLFGLLYISRTLVVPMLANLVRKKPGIDITANSLRIWVAPEEEFALSDIRKIEVGDDVVRVHGRDGHVRSINTGYLNGARYFFFDEVRPRLPNEATIVELGY